MEKRWIYNTDVDEAIIKVLSSSLNIQPRLSTLLALRDITSFDEAKTFFRPSLNHLHDPFLMKDMDKAVNRLCEAISSNQKILIYGDYDVDGTTSVALMYGFLSSFSEHLEYYIPDRYTEGYGISKQGIEYAHSNGFELVISLDCGIRAVKMAHLANSYEIDLIICDHHLPGEELPAAHAILDPKQKDDEYPFKELSGCGVGFKLLQGFCIQNSIPMERLFVHLDLLVVSIASDIVPIEGENRILAFYGLKKINSNPCAGLKALIDVSSLKNELDISSIVFYLGPRINAAGRLGHAHDSVKLLIADSSSDTTAFASVLQGRNTQRKDVDKKITEEALKMIESDHIKPKARSTVLYKNDWHKGVIGIVASRCIERYYRPTIILTESKGKATGSARSINGFDIYTAIASCADLLEQFGGHTHAAGLTLPLENIEAFSKKFEAYVSEHLSEDILQPILDIDLDVPLSFVNYKSYNIIQQMSPFGPRNQKPVFVSKKVRLKQAPKLIKEEHLKLSLVEEGNDLSYEAIGFGLAEHLESLVNAEYFDIAYQIEENQYRGNKSLQLNVKDVKFD